VTQATTLKISFANREIVAGTLLLIGLAILFADDFGQLLLRISKRDVSPEPHYQTQPLQKMTNSAPVSGNIQSYSRIDQLTTKLHPPNSMAAKDSARPRITELGGSLQPHSVPVDRTQAQSPTTSGSDQPLTTMPLRLPSAEDTKISAPALLIPNDVNTAPQPNISDGNPLSHIDQQQRTTAAQRKQSLRYYVDPKKRSASELLDHESRIGTAARLSQLGLETDWQEHSEAEMLDWENRIRTANRLENLGLTVDWTQHSESQMLDCENRIRTADRLRRLGLDVNWQNCTESEMLDWENRISTANRLQARGMKVHWQDYTERELLDLEQSQMRNIH